MGHRGEGRKMDRLIIETLREIRLAFAIIKHRQHSRVDNSSKIILMTILNAF